jgi:signal transduction histidine kinase
LKEEGFSIEAASNVYRAVAAFARRPSALTVVDVDLLGSSELECIRIFRELNPEGFILAVFSQAHRQRAAEALRLGADACLLQPFYPIELVSLIKHWADRASRRRTAAMDYQRHLASLARLAKGIAHEINNPLTTLSGWLEMMASDEKRDPAERERLVSIREEADRISKVVQRLLAFGQEGPAERLPVDMDLLLGELLGDVQRRAGVQVETDMQATGALVLGDADQLRRACRMMLDDAVAALNGRGKIAVRTRRGEDGFLELAVWDNGRQIPAEELPHIFEPYGALPRAGEAMSLTYPAIYGIVRSHGGELSLSSDREHGTEFRVRLPVT